MPLSLSPSLSLFSLPPLKAARREEAAHRSEEQQCACVEVAARGDSSAREGVTIEASVAEAGEGVGDEGVASGLTFFFFTFSLC